MIYIDADHLSDGLYKVKDGKIYKYKAKGGTVRAYKLTRRPQGEWIEVSTLREIFGDVQYAHRGNSEAEAVLADVWDEVKDALKGADDE